VIYAIAGITIIILASLLGVFLVKRQHNDQPKTVKVVLFGLYFWGLVFLQSILCALAFKFLGKPYL
jgi:cytochrome c biogenesis protein ResB